MSVDTGEQRMQDAVKTADKSLPVSERCPRPTHKPLLEKAKKL